MQNKKERAEKNRQEQGQAQQRQTAQQDKDSVKNEKKQNADG